METIGLFSGVLLFSVLCLLPEVRAMISYQSGFQVLKGGHRGGKLGGLRSRFCSGG